MRLMAAIICLGVLVPSMAIAQPVDRERTWTDLSGRFKTQGQFCGFVGAEGFEDSSVLLSVNGQKRKIPLKMLSEADQSYLKSVFAIEQNNHQLALMAPHTSRLINSPLAVLEIIGQLHKQHPHSVSAGIASGTILASLGRNRDSLKQAQKYFDDCLRRLRIIREQFPDALTDSYIAVLNNRAIVALRQRNADRAVALLVEAAQTDSDVPFVVYHNATMLLEVSSQSNTLLDLGRSARMKLVELLASKEPATPGASVPQRFLYALEPGEMVKTRRAAKSENGPELSLITKPKEPEIGSVLFGHELVGFGTGFLISPSLVLTNRHVVDGYDRGMKFRVVNETSNRSGTIATVRKVSTVSHIDLALLELADPVAIEPIPISTDVAPLATEVMALGYPSVNNETGVTFAQGAVAKHLQEKQTLMLNMSISTGNSGGPCLNLEGNLAGVIFAKNNENSTDNTDRGFAIAAPTVRLFLNGVQGYTQLPRNTHRKEAADIVQKYTDSTFRIESFAPPGMLGKSSQGHAENREATLRKLKLWPETTCFTCNGSGFQDCGRCVGGVQSLKFQAPIGRNHRGGIVTGNKVAKQKCTTCRGNGGFTCPHCKGEGSIGY